MMYQLESNARPPATGATTTGGKWSTLMLKTYRYVTCFVFVTCFLVLLSTFAVILKYLCANLQQKCEYCIYIYTHRIDV